MIINCGFVLFLPLFFKSYAQHVSKLVFSANNICCALGIMEQSIKIDLQMRH